MNLDIVAVPGPWTPGIPLPSSVRVVDFGDIDTEKLPDVWVLFNNTQNKRNKGRKRKEIYKFIQNSCKPWIVVESPAFRFNQASQQSENVYYRWSWFSFFNDQGIHFKQDSPSDRWERIQKEQGIIIHPWQHRGDDILFMMQRPGDSSLVPIAEQHGSYQDFVLNSIGKIREVTDRPIKIRLHPLRIERQLGIVDNAVSMFSNVSVSDNSNKTAVDRWISGGDSLYNDFDNAWAVVGANSNSLTESACYGLPTFCMHSSAMAYPVSQTDLHKIEKPDLAIPRNQWLYNLGYCQWRKDEIEQGVALQHLMQWYNKAVKLSSSRFFPKNNSCIL